MLSLHGVVDLGQSSSFKQSPSMQFPVFLSQNWPEGHILSSIMQLLPEHVAVEQRLGATQLLLPHRLHFPRVLQLNPLEHVPQYPPHPSSPHSLSRQFGSHISSQ